MTETTTETFSPAAEAAANWWADQALGRLGDHGGEGVTMALAILAGAQGRDVPLEARDLFRIALARSVDRRLNQDSSWGVTLDVDYGPDRILSGAAREAGLPNGVFPWKTTMWIRSDHITAALGYRAPSSLVWSAPDWKRPICGQFKWGEKHREPWSCSLSKYHEGKHHFSTPETLCQFEIPGEGYPSGTCLRPEDDNSHVAGEMSWSHEFVG